LCRSSEEAHVGAADAIVWIADSAEKPLGNGALSAIGREEVVENGRVEGANGALCEIVVIGFDLRAAVVVRVFNEYLD
jgi:hypothetical protein